MLFPIQSLLEEQRCYEWLLEFLHPQGLCCREGHALPPDQAPHDKHRAPILDSRCRTCGGVFTIFTDTVFQKTRYSCAKIVLFLRGIAKSETTQKLAAELGVSRQHLLSLRHRVHDAMEKHLPTTCLIDPVVETDEMFQNAGEKGIPHRDPDDPPRRRGNKKKGHGTWENDRPPVAGTIGRESKQLRLEMVFHTDKKTLQTHVEDHTQPGSTVNTDEWGGYNGIALSGRIHKTVNHTPGKRQWARDDDGDGIREVHTNTIEGIWTGARNFLRPFRGVSKHFLAGYLAVFELIFGIKDADVARFGQALRR